MISSIYAENQVLRRINAQMCERYSASVKTVWSEQFRLFVALFSVYALASVWCERLLCGRSFGS